MSRFKSKEDLEKDILELLEKHNSYCTDDKGDRSVLSVLLADQLWDGIAPPRCNYPVPMRGPFLHTLTKTYWQTSEYGDICDPCHGDFYLPEKQRRLEDGQ